MFRRFAGKIPEGAKALFQCHPLELTTLMELAWRAQPDDPNAELGRPANRSNLKPIPDFWLEQLRKAPAIEGLVNFEPPTGKDGQEPATTDTTLGKGLNFSDEIKLRRTVLWDHLIYAYMIENTRIYEIFRRVLFEYLHGEKLGIPTPDAQHWLRNTEELFYRDTPSFFISAIDSHIRPDLRGTRRNAYQRMFGMDLNHGTDEGQPYPYVRAGLANNEFVSTFEEFLREVWIGIENLGNSSGAKPTDDAKIADLVEKLHDMLTSRRINGNLSREEFFFVSMMSWFHLSVDFNDSPIVASLRAEAASPEQRLFKIAQMVGLPAHGLSKSYFDIADSMSRVLILIETGAYNTADAAPAFYSEAFGSPPSGDLQKAMKTIIRGWSTITGHDMKARKVATS
jgi:hypothetical protein